MIDLYRTSGLYESNSFSNEDLYFILGITFVVLAIFFVVVIVSYVLMAIPLYKMAKKTVPDKAFLAWIPILGSLILILLNLAFSVFIYMFNFYVRRDLLDTFSPGDNTAITIIGLFIPIVFLIFLYIRASEDPVEYAAADRRI